MSPPNVDYFLHYTAEAFMFQSMNLKKAERNGKRESPFAGNSLFALSAF
jgi:hypothetical protein